MLSASIRELCCTGVKHALSRMQIHDYDNGTMIYDFQYSQDVFISKVEFIDQCFLDLDVFLNLHSSRDR